MSDAPYDRLRATRLLLEAQLAARGGAALDVDDERLRQVLATSGPELRLVVALLETLDIPPGLLPPAAGSADVATPAQEAGATLEENLRHLEAAVPAVPDLSPDDLDRLLSRLERLVESLEIAAPHPRRSPGEAP